MIGREAAHSPGRLTVEEFARQFEDCARPLWAVAAGVLGSPVEAEDVLQEAALLALPKLDGFEPGTSFLAWMGRFVRNVALNHARKRARRRHAAPRPGNLDELVAPDSERTRPPVAGNGRLLADQDAFDDRLLSELRELAPVPRACLLLRTLLELSYREIAEALEIPEGTAMSHVHRSREKLRLRLSAPNAAQPVTPSETGIER